MMTNMHITNPVDRYSYFNSFMGNYGQTGISNNFIDNLQDFQSDFIFEQSLRPFIRKVSDIAYYNTKKPYTIVTYSGSSKANEELAIGVTHTQNVTKRFNVGGYFRNIGSEGALPNERTKNIATNLQTSYLGDKYQLHAGFVYNKYKFRENAGTETDTLELADYINATLVDAYSTYMNRSWYAAHTYRFGRTDSIVINDTTTKAVFTPRFQVEHLIEYQTNYRTFTDEATNGDFEYFSTFNWSETATKDSVNNTVFRNKLHLALLDNNKLKLAARAGMIFENQSFFNLRSYVLTINQFNYTNQIADFQLRIQPIPLVQLHANYQKYVSGYRQDDSRLQAGAQLNFQDSLRYSFLRIGYEQQTRSPSFFYSNYYSNHFDWYNSLEISQQTVLKASYHIPHRSFRLSAQQTTIDQFIYMDTTATPKQMDEKLTVQTLEINKDFHFKHLHFVNKVLLQKSSNDSIINLPLASVYHSTYVEGSIFNKALLFQLGAEVYYSTVYWAKGYQVATGMFYNRYDLETGDYPVVNVFVNATIKTALVFVKYQHVNSAMRDYYYPLAYHPINNLRLQVGVSWRFFN